METTNISSNGHGLEAITAPSYFPFSCRQRGPAASSWLWIELRYSRYAQSGQRRSCAGQKCSQ
eukprot:11655211-Prorocentrum_lima.AAC.1